MTRAFDDKTSTCGSCIYFEADAPDGGPPDGHCNWLSLPAYVYKNVREFNTHMRADAGKDCWLHMKRGVKLDPIDPDRLMQRMAQLPSNVCRVCGNSHNMMPCGPKRGSDNG